ncbi:MAG: hypothetical protein JWL82_321 [Parcubacteria group bacterium]|nr:hypothetical protein [Parcubacteria group bacterium]
MNSNDLFHIVGPLEQAFFAVMARSKDAPASELLTTMFEECEAGFDASAEDKREVNFLKADIALYLLDNMPLSEITPGPLDMQCIPKTMALLWGSLIEGVIAAYAHPDRERIYLSFVGKGAALPFAQKEVSAISAEIRRRLERLLPTAASDVCAKILSHATIPGGYDDVLRIAARSFAHFGSLEVLKAAAHAVCDTKMFSSKLLAEAGPYIESDAKATLYALKTMHALQEYLAERVVHGPGGSAFAKETELSLDHDRVICITCHIDSGKAMTEGQIATDNDWLNSVRIKIDYFRHEKWTGGGMFPSIHLQARSNAGECLAELKF